MILDTLIRRNDRELFLIALRVLARFTGGAQPSRRDLTILRRRARPSETTLPVDDLCCAVIRRELATSDYGALKLAG